MVSDIVDEHRGEYLNNWIQHIFIRRHVQREEIVPRVPSIGDIVFAKFLLKLVQLSTMPLDKGFIATQKIVTRILCVHNSVDGVTVFGLWLEEGSVSLRCDCTFEISPEKVIEFLLILVDGK